MFEERGKDVSYAFSAKLKWNWKILKLPIIWELFVKTDNFLQNVTGDFVRTILHRFLPEKSILLCDIPNCRQHTFGCRSKSSLGHSHSRQPPWAVKQPRLRSFSYTSALEYLPGSCCCYPWERSYNRLKNAFLERCSIKKALPSPLSFPDSSRSASLVPQSFSLFCFSPLQLFSPTFPFLHQAQTTGEPSAGFGGKAALLFCYTLTHGKINSMWTAVLKYPDTILTPVLLLLF